MGHGDIIKILLIHYGLNMSQLSKMANINYMTLYSLVSRNNRETRKDTLLKICNTLNVPLSVFTIADITAGEVKAACTGSDFYEGADGVFRESRVNFGDYSHQINMARKEKGLSYDYILSVLRLLGFDKLTEHDVRSFCEGFDNAAFDGCSELAEITMSLIFRESILTLRETLFMCKLRKLTLKDFETVNYMADRLNRATSEDERRKDIFENPPDFPDEEIIISKLKQPTPQENPPTPPS